MKRFRDVFAYPVSAPLFFEAWHKNLQIFMVIDPVYYRAAVRVFLDNVDNFSNHDPGSDVQQNGLFPPVFLGRVCRSYSFLPTDAQRVFTGLGINIILTRQMIVKLFFDVKFTSG